MLSASQLLYQAAGHEIIDVVEGRCWLCGGELFLPTPVREWMRPTFTGFDVGVGPGESGQVCEACVWSTLGGGDELAAKVGKEKKQRFRNYSLFVAQGEWYALSKAHKPEMKELLLSPAGFPEVALVAESGQKHLAFRGRVNEAGQPAGWVLFERAHIWVIQDAFSWLLGLVEQLYNAGFSKASISTGAYKFYPDSDLSLWRECESTLSRYRGSGAFSLAVYLAQKEESDE